MGSRKPLGDNRISRRIERHSDVSAGHFDIDVGVIRLAVVPVHDAVMAGIDGGLGDRVWNLPPKGIQKTAGTLPGIATGKHAISVLLKNPKTNGLRRAEDGPIGGSSAHG